MTQTFNPKKYLGKNRTQTPTQTSGISRCWTWKQSIAEYVCNSFEARKTNKLGRQKQRFQTMDEAKRWLHGEVNAVENTFKCPKFGEVIKNWQERRGKSLRDNTLRYYQNRITAIEFFLDKHMNEITPTLIDSWLLGEKKKELHGTRCSFDKELKLLRLIFNYYKEYWEDQSFRSPIRGRHFDDGFVKEPTVKNKDLLEEDFLKFRAKLETLSNGRLFAALATLQYYCSLRIGEAAGVYKQDLKFGDKPEENKGVFCRAVKWIRNRGDEPVMGPLKNSREIGYKTLPLHPDVKEYVEPFANLVTEGPIFHLDRNLLTFRQIDSRYNRAFKLAGIDFRGTHVLRHGSVRQFYSEHGDFGIAKMQLGNKSSRSVEVYAQPLQRSLDNYVYQKQWAKKLAADGGQKKDETEKQENPDT